MNANAYGGELARVLEWVDVVTAAGTERRAPEQLGFAYRRSNLRPARSSRGPRSRSAGAGRTRSRRRSPTCARGARRRSRPASRRSARPSRTRDDPRAEGRTAGQLLDAAGCRGLRIGGAGFSDKHANFVENHGEATTADVIAVMAEGRRRVKQRFGIELEPEVQASARSIPADWGARDRSASSGPSRRRTSSSPRAALASAAALGRGRARGDRGSAPLLLVSALVVGAARRRLVLVAQLVAVGRADTSR